MGNKWDYYLYNGIFYGSGAIDKCIGNKFGYGEKFEEGIMAMGALDSIYGWNSFSCTSSSKYLKTNSWTSIFGTRSRPCNVCYYIISKWYGEDIPLAMSLAQDPMVGKLQD